MPTDMTAPLARPAPAPMPAGTTGAGISLLLFTCLVWGINWPVLKLLLGQMPPLSARAAGGLIGTALSLAIAVLRREVLLPPAGCRGRLCLAAGLNVTAWMGFTTLSLLWLRAGETTILAYTLPIWTALLAWPLLGERPGLRQAAGTALGLAGVVLLLANGAPAEIVAKLPGVGLALAGSMLFALGAVLTKRRPLGLPAAAGAAWQTGLGVLPLGIIGLVFEDPHYGRLDGTGWLALVYSGLFAFSLAYLSWFAALRRLPATVATVGSLLVPVVGVIGAGLLLDEPVGLREAGALLLTLAGVGLASGRRPDR